MSGCAMVQQMVSFEKSPYLARLPMIPWPQHASPSSACLEGGGGLLQASPSAGLPFGPLAWQLLEWSQGVNVPSLLAYGLSQLSQLELHGSAVSSVASLVYQGVSGIPYLGYRESEMEGGF